MMLSSQIILARTISQGDIEMCNREIGPTFGGVILRVWF